MATNPWGGFTAYDQNHGAGAFARNTAQLSAFENGAGYQADGTYGTGVGRMTPEQMEAGRRAQTYGGYSTGSGYGQQPTTPDGYNPATSPGGYGGMPPGGQTQTPWQMMGVQSPWNADGTAKPNALGSSLQGGPGGGTAGTVNMTSPGIDWMSTDKQNSLRQVMGNQGQTAQNMSSAMREWGVSNSALMNAMGWNQQQFDDYFKPVFGNQSPQGMGGGTTGMTKPMQLPGGNSYSGGNPYLSQMADEIGRRSNEGLQRSLQGIRTNAVGVGGLGGSRQGVAESGAIGASQDSLQGQLANLFGNQYNQDENRGLQRYGMDQSDSTQRYGMDQNYDINSQRTRNDFYTSQRGQDLTQFGIGVDAYGKGMEGPWGPVKNAASVYNAYAKDAQAAGANKSNWQTVLGTGLQALDFAQKMGWLS